MDLAAAIPEFAPLFASIILKGALILAIVAAAVCLLHRTAAAVRHAVWTAGFAAVIALPLFLLTLPSWEVPILPAGETLQAEAIQTPLAPAPPAGGLAPAPSPPAPEVDALLPATPEPDRPAPAGPDHTVTTPAEPAGEGMLSALGNALSVDAIRGSLVAMASHGFAGLPSPLRQPVVWLVVLWAIGAIMVAGRWAIAFAGARRLVQGAVPVRDATWTKLAERFSRDLGIRAPIRLLRSDRLAVPVAWCFGRCAVVLPGDSDEWSDDRREVVLLHELAHIARMDGLTQLLAQVTVVLHWFNPLAWHAYRRFLIEREHACDDLVLLRGTLPSAYAQHLLQIASRFRQESIALLAVAAMARRADLRTRIESILDARQVRGTVRRPVLAVAAVLGLGLMIPLAAFQPVSPAGTSSEPAVVADQWTWSGTIRDGGQVEVYALNGAVNVQTGTGNAVSVRANPRRIRDDNPRLVVTESRDRITICILHGNQSACEAGRGPRGNTGGRNNSEVSVTVTMPAAARLAARTTNGAIETQLMAAEIDAQTTNGSVNVSSRRGDVTARTTNGAVRVGASGRVTAQTTNGSIQALLADTAWRGEARLATTNGSITVELPAAANVDVEARTRSGRIRSHFALDVRSGRGSGATASGRLGSGGRTLNATTTNGSITLNEAGRAAISYPVDRDAAEFGLAAAEAAIGMAEATTFAVLDSGVIEAAIASAMEGINAARIIEEIQLAFDGDELQRAFDEATRAIEAVDFAAIDTDVRRALEAARVELEAIDHDAIREEARRAMDEARREMEEIDYDEVRRSIESARIEFESIDRGAIREEVRREMEAARRDLEEARREMEEARRERNRTSGSGNG